MKGGAYGCMSSFLRNGDSFFVSYRDPKLAETNAVFEGIPDYVKAFDACDRDMTKYIIGTISDMDTPLNPDAKGIRSTTAYLTGLTEDVLQKERDELHDSDIAAVNKVGELLKKSMENKSFCTVGNTENIMKNADLYDEIIKL